MPKITRFVAASACVILMPTWAFATADATATQKQPAEVSVPNSRRVDFVSKINGHRYSIMVAMPFAPAPPKGFGVLYVIDGDDFFGSAAEAVRNWNVSGLVVVGIGYPRGSKYCNAVLQNRGPVADGQLKTMPACLVAPSMERNYDLTLPMSDDEIKAETFPWYPIQKSRNVGGLDDFLKTIEADVKPRIAALLPVDSANQALFGYSLGGLAVLHALFTEPNAFRTFVIGSPSIWWNHKAVLRGQAKFEAAVTSGAAHPRILVTMGSEESTGPKSLPSSWMVTQEQIAEELRYGRMVENASELVAWLKSIHGDTSYRVEDYALFDRLFHGRSAWAALGRAVEFAFPE